MIINCMKLLQLGADGGGIGERNNMKLGLAFSSAMFLFTLSLSVISVFAQSNIPNKMCSNGFDEPAYLLMLENGYELHIGSKTEILEGAGSVGTGINGGLVMAEGQSELEVILYSEIIMDVNNSPEDIQPSKVANVGWQFGSFASPRFIWLMGRKGSLRLVGKAPICVAESQHLNSAPELAWAHGQFEKLSTRQTI